MNFTISDDKALIDRDLVFNYLHNESYWAKGVERSIVERSMDNALCFGVYNDTLNQQIGFARVITDSATFAYLADVFILPEFRRQGLSKQLMQHIMDHNALQNLRRFMLCTFDAHALYEQFEFSVAAKPERLMEIVRPYSAA